MNEVKHKKNNKDNKNKKDEKRGEKEAALASSKLEKSSSKNSVFTSLTTISIWTPGGSDGSLAALELANYIAKTFKEKVAIVELPCLGIPRLAIHVDIYDKEKNTDKLLLDLERSEYTNIYPAKYLLQISNLIGVMTINPFSTPDLSMELRLNKLNTLTDFPGYLKGNLYLEGYKFVIYILQGQIYHPLTFFGVRESDKVILNVNYPIELGWDVSCFNKLTSSYNQAPDKFVLYSAVVNAKNLSGISDIKYIKAYKSLFKEKGER